MSFFRKPSIAAAPCLTPPPVRASAIPVVEPLQYVSVEAGALGTARLTGTGLLLVAAAGEARRGERVTLLVSGIEQAVFPITGMVREAQGSGASRLLEILIDEDRRGLLQRILEHVQDGAARPRARAPRFRVSMPAVVATSGGAQYMTAFSLSRGGCALRWTGPAPSRGSTHELRLGAGASAPLVRAVVCWVKEEPSGTRVGFRLVAGQDGRLDALLDGVRRSAPRP
jgi:hypothetical protein